VRRRVAKDPRVPGPDVTRAARAPSRCRRDEPMRPDQGRPRGVRPYASGSGSGADP
jgi:hypothetical protein